jgi:hypothetical protein
MGIIECTLLTGSLTIPLLSRKVMYHTGDWSPAGMAKKSQSQRKAVGVVGGSSLSSS